MLTIACTGATAQHQPHSKESPLEDFTVNPARQIF